MEFNIDNVLTTQDELVAIQVNKYDQLMSKPGLLYWDELTEDISISKRKRIFNWVQTNAVLRKSALGANRRYDDQVDASAELTSENYEGSLAIGNNEYEDDELDHAAAWARDIAGYEALLPQILLVDLIAQGGTLTSYDGVPFFSTTHPVLVGGDEGFNKNKWTGYPLTPAGLAALTKDIKSQLKTFNLPNAYVMPTRLWVNPQTEFPGQQTLGAEIIGHLVADGVNGSKSNLLAQQAFKNIYGWSGGDSAHAGCPSVHELLGRVRHLRPITLREALRAGYSQPFETRMYTKADQVLLGRANKTEWQKDGRIAMRYGEPMAFHKVSP